jgi:Sortase domain
VWDVGWYRYGAVPGARGNAVLLAHVDTYAGPAVFYNLYRLLPGEQVEVDLGGRGIQRFTVRWVKEVLKTDFPSAKVFGRTDGTHLWLITCGGAFDYQTRSYLSNIVVYTTAVTHRARRPHKPRQPHRKVSSVLPAQGKPAAPGGNTTGPANAATVGPDQPGTSVPGVQSGGPPPTRSAGISQAYGSRSLQLTGRRAGGSGRI